MRHTRSIPPAGAPGREDSRAGKLNTPGGRAITTEEALLAAIWASPHDDLPRLVYADWCDENGRPERAEFIRVQCEVARTNEGEPRRRDLSAREVELWRHHARSFRKGLTGKLVNEPFRRGFVAPRRRMMVLDQFLNWSEGQLYRAPLWEFDVNFRPAERVVELTRSPRLRHLGFLGLWDMTDEQAVAVADSPHAVNLSGIHCRHGVMTADGVRAIAQSPHLPHLTELILDTGTRVDEPFARELCRLLQAGRLNRLDLRDSPHIDEIAYLMLGSMFRGRVLFGADRFK